MFLETYNEPVKYELQSPQPFFKRIGGLTVFKRTENNCLRSLLIALFSLLINQGTVRADDNVQNAPSASMNERVLSVPGDPERPASHRADPGWSGAVSITGYESWGSREIKTR